MRGIVMDGEGEASASHDRFQPDAYAECFKRDIGGDVYHRKIRGVDVPPEVLSAFVLERLKTDAEKRLGPIRQVVITYRDAPGMPQYRAVLTDWNFAPAIEPGTFTFSPPEGVKKVAFRGAAGTEGGTK